MESWEALPYDQVLTRQNVAALALWPWPLAVFVIAEAVQLYSAGECSKGHAVIAVVGVFCRWALANAIESRRTTMIRSIFLAFGCLQIASRINYVRGKDTLNNVHLYIDVGTNFYALTPQLVFANGLPIEAYVLFIGCHVASATLLYCHVAGMSWYFALLRALGIHALPFLAALIVHKRARNSISSSHLASQQQHKQQQLLQYEGLSKAGSAKQSSLAFAHTPLAGLFVSLPAISTKVVRHLLKFLRQRRSTLHSDTSTPQRAKAGSTSDREPQGDVKIVQQQAPHAHAQTGPGMLGTQQQQLKQHAGAQAQAEPQVYQEQQQLKQAKQQQQQQAQQQQWCSPGASAMGVNAADQQQGASECHSNNIPDKEEWTSSSSSTRRAHETHNSSNPALQKAMVQAAQVLEQRRCEETLYASKLDTQCRCSRRDNRSALHRVQESCRLIVKLSGPTTPDHISGERFAQLQHRLQKYQCLMQAVRSGCLVISFDTAPLNPECALEEMSNAILAEAREWAQEQGLLEAGMDLLTVQACRSTHWDSALDVQSFPIYSMAVHAPFLVLRPASSTQSQPLQQQNDYTEDGHAEGMLGHAGNEAPETIQEQEALCEFELTVRAPEGGFELRGWQGAAPEDLPDAVKPRSLCLLATFGTGGRYLGVTVKKECLKENRERVAQVCVKFSDFLDTSSSCPRPLMLELWASGTLVCTYSAMLVPSSSPAGAAALEELQGWASGLTSMPPEGSGPFMRDLVRWMRFQASAQQQQQQQQQQQHLAPIAAKDADLLAGPMQQQQQQQQQQEQQHQQGVETAGGGDLTGGAMQEQHELMATVGADLLEYSLSHGMVAVAGLLLDCFASFPFCLPHLTLLDTLSAARPESQPNATSKSTLHSTMHLSGNPHSRHNPAASAPSTPATADPAATPRKEEGVFPLYSPTRASERFEPPTSKEIGPNKSERLDPTGFPPSSAFARFTAALSAVCCKLAAVARGLCAQPRNVEEEGDYHAWSNAQVVPLARLWCRLSVLHICAGVLRTMFAEGMPPLQALSSWGILLLGYATGALFIQPGSPYSSEVFIATLAVARAFHCFALGLFIKPFSNLNYLMFRWRVELVVEVFLMSLMERVRMRWMVPLRALLGLSYFFVYKSKLGLPWPATQSMLFNLCSLGVTAAVEWRYRHVYKSQRLHAK